MTWPIVYKNIKEKKYFLSRRCISCSFLSRRNVWTGLENLLQKRFFQPGCTWRQFNGPSIQKGLFVVEFFTFLFCFSFFQIEIKKEETEDTYPVPVSWYCCHFSWVSLTRICSQLKLLKYYREKILMYIVHT